MDLQTLTNLFATTYNADPNVRKAAELEIRKIAGQEGLIVALVQIIATDNVDIATRQACAVWVKNRTFTFYRSPTEVSAPNVVPMPDSDRAALRSSILRLIATSPSRPITTQLANTLRSIVTADFPSHWTTLPEEIKALLHSGDIREVHAGCVAALEAVRAFRFRQKDDHMPQIVEFLFPSLVTIATNMMQTPPSTAQEIPTMLHLVLKAYRTSIILNLSPHQQSNDSLVPWGRLLFSVVNLQIPNEVVPDDEDEREVSEWWKAKKWAYNTLGRLFHRFGNPSQLPPPMKKEYGAFAEHFVTMFAPEILSTHLRQVELYVAGQAWLSKKCQYQIFTFFSECVKPKATWALFKPHFQTLLSSMIFPKLAFTAEKKELWDNDPVDYVRISIDEYEAYATPVAAATTLLLSVANNRTKTAFMPILGFINTILRSGAAPEQRFGALNMTAALGSSMMLHPDVQGEMEQFVISFVTPEFSSEQGYLRAVACEVVGTLTKCGLKFSNQANLDANFRAVAAALDDTEFPVRVQAALALTELILVHDSVRSAVAPQVGKVIQDLLKLSDEMDLDILNHSMEVMVEQFQTELLPVAAQLAARLCDTYLRLARETVAEDDNLRDMQTQIDLSADTEDDKLYTAMGIGKTIWTVVSAIDSSPEILAHVQEICIPIIVYTLENKLLDLFDAMFDLVDSLTFKTRAVSPTMWPVFELTYKLFKSDAIDFLEEMLPSLDNFVSYGSSVIATRPDYMAMLLDIYTTAMTDPHLGANDAVNGCKLAEAMLLNLRGHIDSALEPIIVIALDQFTKTSATSSIPVTTALRLANTETIINAILYNPSAALHIMERTRPGKARVFIDRWFKDIAVDQKLPRVHDKKLTILALCALLEMQPQEIPESLKEGWPGIVGGIVKVFHDLPRAIEARKTLEEYIQNDTEDSDDDDEAILNMDDDDDDVRDADNEYLDMLASESARIRSGAPPQGGSDDDDDGEDSDDDIEEELGYISALDPVNPYVTFRKALTTFQMQNPAGYAEATTRLDLDQQTLLMELMRKADEASAAA